MVETEDSVRRKKTRENTCESIKIRKTQTKRKHAANLLNLKNLFAFYCVGGLSYVTAYYILQRRCLFPPHLVHSLGWARDALYLFLGFLFLCHIISVTRGTHENGLRAHQTRGVSGLVVVAHTHVSSVFLLRPSRTARTRSYFGRHGASRSVPFLSKKAIYFRILFMLLFRHSLRPRFYITLISP